MVYSVWESTVLQIFHVMFNFAYICYFLLGYRIAYYIYNLIDSVFEFCPLPCNFHYYNFTCSQLCIALELDTR